MGIFTKLSLKATHDWLQKSYGLTPLTLTPTENGISDTTYIVATAEGRTLILKRFEKTPEAVIKAEHTLLRRLAQEGLRVPLPLPPLASIPLKGKPAALYTALPGYHPQKPDAAQIAAVGQFLGRLHTLTQGRAGGCPPLSEACGMLERHIATTPFAPYRTLLEAMRKEPVQGIIHGDLFPDNALFDGGELGVIDFIEACPGPFGFDLGVAAFSWCGGDVEKERLLLASYRSAFPRAPLTDDAFLQNRAHAALFYGIKRFLRNPDRDHPGVQECLKRLESSVPG